MQDDSGIKQILTHPRVYNAYQNLVGATRGRKWVSEHFWRVHAGQRVVDIGCGPGNSIQHLPAGVEYVGFDVSDRYIRHAREAFADDPDKTFIVGSAEDFLLDLPEPMCNADLVILSGLLHHLGDPEALTALRLAKKALSPHGRMVSLDGCFLVKQARLAYWLVSQDRGRNVRSEPEWKALAGQVFERFDTYILTGLDRTPYTYILIEAFGEPRSREPSRT